MLERLWFKLFIISLVSITQAATAHAGTSLTLNTAGQSPLNTIQQTGFLDLVTKDAMRRIGITLKSIHLPAERGLKNANAGIEDGEMSRISGLSKFYPNLIQVPEPIMQWEFVVFSKKKLDLSNGWDSLNSYNIGFVNGWKIIEGSVPKLAISTRVRNIEQLFTLLEKDRVDLIIYERWAGLQYIKEHGLNSIKLQSPVLAKRDMYIYLHKKHAKLVPLLSQSLKTIKQDGSYEKYVQQVLTPLIQN